MKYDEWGKLTRNQKEYYDREYGVKADQNWILYMIFITILVFVSLIFGLALDDILRTSIDLSVILLVIWFSILITLGLIEAVIRYMKGKRFVKDCLGK